MRALRFEDTFVTEGALQGGLHLHRPKLFDGEIEVRLRLGLLGQIALQQQLRKLEAGQRQFWSMPETGRRVNGLGVKSAGIGPFTQQHGGRAQNATKADESREYPSHRRVRPEALQQPGRR